MKRVTLSLLGLVLALTFAPSAGATGYASGPPLSPGERTAVEPQVVLTPDGGRVVAWVQHGSDGQSGENISVRSAAPGGDFGATQTFPDADSFAELHMAAGSDGTVALAWVDQTANSIRVARRSPGEKTFTDAAPLRPTNENITDLNLAVAGGDAYVSFSSSAGRATTFTSVWAGRLAAGEDTVKLAPGTALAGALDHTQFNAGQLAVVVATPRLAIDAGQPVVTWQRQTSAPAGQTGRTELEIARRGGGGTFPAPGLVVTLGSTSSSPRFVVPTIAAGGGHTYVLWDTPAGGLVFKDLAAPATTVAIPSGTKFAGGALFAAADDSGALIAAWEGRPDGLHSSVIESFVAPPDAAPPMAVALTPTGPGRRLDDLAVAPDGSALVVFDREPQNFRTAEHLEGSLRIGAGAFGPVEDITGLQDVPDSVSHDASASVVSGGRAVALWSAADHSGATNQRLHISERDTAPPTLDVVDAPASAIAGSPAHFTAAASDALSGATVSWNFGDGSEADGVDVSHTFGSPGAATVTITATDGAGNSAQQTRVVAVAPAPADEGPGADRTPPTVRRVGLSRKRFRAGRKGTALRLTLSERATVVVTVKRGRVLQRTLVRASVRPGAASLAISGKTLRPGLYTATVSAIDGAGNRSAPHSVKFRIVKRQT